MKIHLVTGATGFVGKYLVDALLEKGERVWVIVRPMNNLSAGERVNDIFHEQLATWSDVFRVVDGDITVEGLGIRDSIVAELKNCKVIFWHLAANLSFAAKNRPDVQKTNYIGTVNVVKFANKVAKRFMHMSTAYVCGNAVSFKEDELYKGQKFRNHYEKSKFEAEKYVRDNCKLQYIIFRPSVIIGDAYRGKAEGCTFGYYRYMFMFHFFKKHVIKSLRKNDVAAFCFKIFGTEYDLKDDILKIPWLVIPYPKNGRVDLVTVDYVIKSMVSLYEKNLHGITVHLTHHNLPAFNFLLRAVLLDLGFGGVKLVPVPVWTFRAIINCFYLLAVPLRKYIRSIMWYVPYFTETCEFERSVVEHHLENPPEISRELIARINTYAKENILEHIKV